MFRNRKRISLFTLIFIIACLLTPLLQVGIITDSVYAATANLALNKPAFSNQPMIYGYGADKAVDGDIYTYAQAVSRFSIVRGDYFFYNTGICGQANIRSVPWSLTVDLGSSMTFQKAVITPDAANFISQYTIEGSDDNLKWAVIAKETAGSGAGKTYLFNPVKYRYVKVNVTAAQYAPGGWGHAIREFEVYEDTKPTPVPTPTPTPTPKPTYTPVTPTVPRNVTVGYLVDDWLTQPAAYGITSYLSGWDYSFPSSAYPGNSYNGAFNINDTSVTDDYQMKKRFVEQSSGNVTFDFTFLTDMNGCAFQLMSDTTAAVKLLTSGGNICYENSEGSAVSLQPYSAGAAYGVKVIADIAGNLYDIYIDGVRKASGVPFRNKVTKLNYVSLNTSYEGVGVLYIKPIRVYKGYLVNEQFITSAIMNVPDDWTVTNTGGTANVQEKNSNYIPDTRSLKLEDTSSVNNVDAMKSFDNQQGRIVFEYNFLLPDAVNGMAMELRSGDTTAVKIMTSGGNICYEDSTGESTTLWSSYLSNFWYNVRIVADEASDKADIYINGKIKASDVDFHGAVTGFDNICFLTPASSTGTLWIDDITVYPFQAEPEDYVPVPVPASTSYHLGVQACNLWRETNHEGWDAIEPFSDKRKPLLGWYSEGTTSEINDWEIKWMVEHGIEFSMNCFYGSNASSEPIKNPTHVGNAVNNGFMYAKYSSYAKFALMMTLDLMGSVSESNWKNNVVPYLIEYYFKDDRYEKIDNKPVLGFLGMPYTGDPDDAIQYLKDACVKAGFDGCYIFQNTDKYNNGPQYGMDYVFTYGYGDHFDGELQKDKINSLKKDIVIPTISMGWDCEPWNTITTGSWGSKEDFKDVCLWVKNVFMPAVKEGRLGKTMVLFDNWNEFGEGHNILPASGYGFDYLDAIREVFTSNTPHTESAPTDSQKARYDTLYPHGDW